MPRPANTAYRRLWWEEQLNEAEDAKKKFDLLAGKLAADTKKLPEGMRDEIYEQAADVLEGLLEGVGGSLETIGEQRRAGAFR